MKRLAFGILATKANEPTAMRTATQITVGIGALITIAVLAYAGDSGASLLILSGFSIWALVPYAVLLACSHIARTGGRALAAFIVSILAAALAVLIYGDAFFVHVSSTSGLVFIFIPLYQLIAAAILFAVLFFTRSSNANRSA